MSWLTGPAQYDKAIACNKAQNVAVASIQYTNKKHRLKHTRTQSQIRIIDEFH